MLDNVSEIFQKAYHVDLHFTYVAALTVPFIDLTRALFFSRWSVFMYPANDFKLLTVYPKTLPLRCLKGFADCTW